MTGFSIDWLDLREGADRRARADKLLEQARHWLQSDAAPQSEITWWISVPAPDPLCAPSPQQAALIRTRCPGTW